MACGLLALCLSVLALRVTYTESPTAQMLTLPGGLGDTVYSLTLSGLLIFALVLWVWWRILRNDLVYRFTGMEIGLALFAVAAVISAWGASDQRAALTQIMTLLGPLCAALLLAQILDSPGKVRLVLIVVVGLGLVSAYQCAEQFFFSNSITIEQYEKNPQMLMEPLGIEPGTFQHFLFEHRLYSRGVRGFFTTSNSAASFAILVCAAAAVLLIRGRDAGESPGVEPRYRVFRLLAALLIVAGLLLTQSKGGILAACAGLAFWGLMLGIEHWAGDRKRRVLTVLVPAVLLLAVGAAGIVVWYGVRHDRLPGGNSMLVRWQYWAASAQMIADHPLRGVGPGNFSDYYTHYKPAAALESVADPHNVLLSLMAQFGPLGLIGFLTMVSVPLWRSLVGPWGSAATETPVRPAFRTCALALLVGVSACLLLIRPLLMPMSADDPAVLLYEIMTMHVAPAAVFFIGFLLVASPLADAHWERIDGTGRTEPTLLGSAVLAVLLHNLIDFALFEPGVWLAFWVVTACLAASYTRGDAGLHLAARRTRVLKPLVSAVAVVALGSYGLWIWAPAYGVALEIGRAQQAVSRGNLDNAHRHLEAASQADPLSPVAANFNGRLYLQQHEQTQDKQPALLKEAVRCFTEAMERGPADYKNYEKLALACERLGQPQQAYEWYMQATDHYPGCERLWFELGRLAERLNRPDLALAHYTKTIEIEDSYRRQFRQMYPDRKKVVSRLGEEQYQHAQRRTAELSRG
ncbi:MAG: O-antigen ligase family protein [Planctomycetes bacterium]|jgi:tetratricopeptide (TPR) repeat protein|nr:O-antigen ligase family protein [Planctomycetota bacterium]